MQAIQAPIEPGESGPQVANLQDALRLLLERGVIRSLDPPNSPTAEELAQLAQVLLAERVGPVYRNTTVRLVQIVQIQQGLGDNLDGAVEEKTADVLNRLLKELGALDETEADEFTVAGRITLVNGMPGAGYIVRACARRMRTFQPVGKETVTDPDGRYTIRYASGQFSRAEKKASAGLVVRVFSPNSASEADTPLAESPTLYNPRAVVEIDLQIPDSGVIRSEFEGHVEAIAPLLAGQGADGGDLSITALTEQEIDILAGQTGI